MPRSTPIRAFPEVGNGKISLLGTGEIALANSGISPTEQGNFMAGVTSKTAGDEAAIPYAGPVINGRPALTIQETQKWFEDAYGVVPCAAEVTPITQGLNHCLLFQAQWKDTPEFKELRRNNPSKLRMERLSEALATLQEDLPALIDDTLQIRPDAKGSAGLALT